MAKKLHNVKPDKPDYISDKNVRFYPTFNIDSDDLPELKDFKVGEKKMLLMEVEQMSMSQGKEWQGSSNDKDSKKIKATFKILKVGVQQEKQSYSDEYAQKRSNAPRA